MVDDLFSRFGDDEELGIRQFDDDTSSTQAVSDDILNRTFIPARSGTRYGGVIDRSLGGTGVDTPTSGYSASVFNYRSFDPVEPLTSRSLEAKYSNVADDRGRYGIGEPLYLPDTVVDSVESTIRSDQLAPFNAVRADELSRRQPNARGIQSLHNRLTSMAERLKQNTGGSRMSIQLQESTTQAGVVQRVNVQIRGLDLRQTTWEGKTQTLRGLSRPQTLSFEFGPSGSIIERVSGRLITGAVRANPAVDSRMTPMEVASGIVGSYIWSNYLQSNYTMVDKAFNRMMTRQDYHTYGKVFGSAGVALGDELLGQLLGNETSSRSIASLLNQRLDQMAQVNLDNFPGLSIAFGLMDDSPTSRKQKAEITRQITDTRRRILKRAFNPMLTASSNDYRSVSQLNRAIQTSFDALTGVLTSKQASRSYMGMEIPIFQDLKQRMVMENTRERTRLRHEASEYSKQVKDDLLAPYLQLHDLSYSQGQSLARTPVYQDPDLVSPKNLMEYASKMLTDSGDLTILRGAEYSHGMQATVPGQFIRTISATARSREKGAYNFLNAGEGGSESLAVFYDRSTVFNSMSQLRESSVKQVSSLLTQLGYKDPKSIITHMSNRKNGELDEEAMLLFMPFRKPQQMMQRIKNMMGTRPAMQTDVNLLKAALEQQDIGGYTQAAGHTKDDVKFQMSAGKYLTGDLPASLPQRQYLELQRISGDVLSEMGVIEGDLEGNQVLRAEYERRLMEAARNQAAQPYQETRGLIRGGEARRMLVNIGVNTMSDFTYVNADYLDNLSFSYSHDVRFSIDRTRKIPGTASIYDNNRITSSLYRQQMSAVQRAFGNPEATRFIYHSPTMLKDQAAMAMVKQTYSRMSKVYGHDAAVEALYNQYSYLERGSLVVEDKGTDRAMVREVKLRAGLYGKEEGRLQFFGALNDTMLEVGEDFHYVGDITRGADGRAEVRRRQGIMKIDISGAGRNQQGGVSFIRSAPVFDSKGSKTSVTLSLDTWFKGTTGSRPGDPNVKNPLNVVEAGIFNELDPMMQERTKGFSPASGNSQIFGIMNVSGLKGYNFESGLELIRTKQGLAGFEAMGGREMALNLALALVDKKDDSGLRSAVSRTLGKAQSGDKTASMLRHLLDTGQFGVGAGDFNNLIGNVTGVLTLSDNRGRVGTGSDAATEVINELRRTLAQALGDDKAAAKLKTRVMSLFNTARSTGFRGSEGRVSAMQESDPFVRGAAFVADMIFSQHQMRQGTITTRRNLNEFSLLDKEGRGNVQRFLNDTRFREAVSDIAAKSGFRLPGAVDLERIGRGEYQEGYLELQSTLSQIGALFSQQMLLQRSIELTPSATLTAAGSQEAVQLEYQYLLAMNKKELHRLQGGAGNLDNLSALQVAYQVVTSPDLVSAMANKQSMRVVSPLHETSYMGVETQDFISKFTRHYSPSLNEVGATGSSLQHGLGDAAALQFIQSGSHNALDHMVNADRTALEYVAGSDNQPRVLDTVKNSGKLAVFGKSLDVTDPRRAFLSDFLANLVQKSRFDIKNTLISSKSGPAVVQQFLKSMKSMGLEISEREVLYAVNLITEEYTGSYKGAYAGEFKAEDLKKDIFATLYRHDSRVMNKFEAAKRESTSDRFMGSLYKIASTAKAAMNVGVEGTEGYARAQELFRGVYETRALMTLDIEILKPESGYAGSMYLYDKGYISGGKSSGAGYSGEAAYILGLDVLQSIPTEYGGFIPTVVPDQIRLRQIEPEYRRIAEKLRRGPIEAATPEEIAVVQEMQQLAQRTSQSLAEIGTSILGKRAGGHNVRYPGRSGIGMASYLLGMEEAVAGSSVTGKDSSISRPFYETQSMVQSARNPYSRFLRRHSRLYTPPKMDLDPQSDKSQRYREKVADFLTNEYGRRKSINHAIADPDMLGYEQAAPWLASLHDDFYQYTRPTKETMYNDAPMKGWAVDKSVEPIKVMHQKEARMSQYTQLQSESYQFHTELADYQGAEEYLAKQDLQLADELSVSNKELTPIRRIRKGKRQRGKTTKVKSLTDYTDYSAIPGERLGKYRSNDDTSRLTGQGDDIFLKKLSKDTDVLSKVEIGGDGRLYSYTRKATFNPGVMDIATFYETEYQKHKFHTTRKKEFLAKERPPGETWVDNLTDAEKQQVMKDYQSYLVKEKTARVHSGSYVTHEVTERQLTTRENRISVLESKEWKLYQRTTRAEFNFFTTISQHSAEKLKAITTLTASGTSSINIDETIDNFAKAEAEIRNIKQRETVLKDKIRHYQKQVDQLYMEYRSSDAVRKGDKTFEGTGETLRIKDYESIREQDRDFNKRLRPTKDKRTLDRRIAQKQERIKQLKAELEDNKYAERYKQLAKDYKTSVDKFFSPFKSFAAKTGLVTKEGQIRTLATREGTKAVERNLKSVDGYFALNTSKGMQFVPVMSEEYLRIAETQRGELTEGLSSIKEVREAMKAERIRAAESGDYRFFDALSGQAEVSTLDATMQDTYRRVQSIAASDEYAADLERLEAALGQDRLRGEGKYESRADTYFKRKEAFDSGLETLNREVGAETLNRHYQNGLGGTAEDFYALSRDPVYDRINNLVDFYRGNASFAGYIERAGSPTGGSPISQLRQVHGLQLLRDRAQSENSAFVPSEVYGQTSLIMSAYSAYAAQGGDWDGDSYGLVKGYSDQLQEVLTLTKKREGILEALRSLDNEARAKTSLGPQRQELKATLQSDLSSLESMLDSKIGEMEESRLTINQSKMHETARQGMRRHAAALTGIPTAAMLDERMFGQAEIVNMLEHSRSVMGNLEIHERSSKLQTLNKMFTQTYGADAATRDQIMRREGYSDDLKRDYTYLLLEMSKYGDKNSTALERFQQAAAEMTQLKVSSDTFKKISTSAAGTVLDIETFETAQTLIGNLGTTLIGEGYNSLVGLIPKATISRSLATLLGSTYSGQGMVGDGPSPSTYATMLAANLDQMGRSDLASVFNNKSQVAAMAASANNRAQSITGTLSLLQQVMRDSLKPKDNQGLFGILGPDIVDTIMNESDDNKRLRQIREFLGTRKVHKGLTGTAKAQLNTFGAIFLLSDYVTKLPGDYDETTGRYAVASDEIERRMSLPDQYGDYQIVAERMQYYRDKIAGKEVTKPGVYGDVDLDAFRSRQDPTYETRMATDSDYAFRQTVVDMLNVAKVEERVGKYFALADVADESEAGKRTFDSRKVQTVEMVENLRGVYRRALAGESISAEEAAKYSQGVDYLTEIRDHLGANDAYREAIVNALGDDRVTGDRITEGDYAQAVKVMKNLAYTQEEFFGIKESDLTFMRDQSQRQRGIKNLSSETIRTFSPYLEASHNAEQAMLTLIQRGKLSNIEDFQMIQTQQNALMSQAMADVADQMRTKYGDGKGGVNLSSMSDADLYQAVTWMNQFTGELDTGPRVAENIPYGPDNRTFSRQDYEDIFLASIRDTDGRRTSLIDDISTMNAAQYAAESTRRSMIQAATTYDQLQTELSALEQGNDANSATDGRGVESKMRAIKDKMDLMSQQQHEYQKTLKQYNEAMRANNGEHHKWLKKFGQTFMESKGTDGYEKFMAENNHQQNEQKKQINKQRMMSASSLLVAPLLGSALSGDMEVNDRVLQLGFDTTEASLAYVATSGQGQLARSAMKASVGFEIGRIRQTVNSQESMTLGTMVGLSNELLIGGTNKAVSGALMGLGKTSGFAKNIAASGVGQVAGIAAAIGASRILSGTQYGPDEETYHDYTGDMLAAGLEQMGAYANDFYDSLGNINTDGTTEDEFISFELQEDESEFNERLDLGWIEVSFEDEYGEPITFDDQQSIFEQSGSYV